MTGVVEAGFVLAAFPLLISALEHYRDGAKIAGGWWTIRRDYTRYKQTLEVQHQMFRDNLEELLAPVVNDEDQLNLLLNEPGGTEWADPILEGKLHDRLPRSYRLYVDLIHRMTAVMEEVTGISRVDQETAEVETTDSQLRASLNRLRSRAKLGSQGIRFAWKETLREEHLSRISQYNSDLRELRASSDRLAESRRVRAVKTKVGKTLTAFWRHANNLYAVLMDAWRCDCQHFHHANLLLLHRTTAQIDFNIMFQFAQSAAIQKPRPWIWQEASIVVLEGAEKPRAMSSTTPIREPPIQPTNPGTTPNSASNRSRKGKKAVAFVEVTALPAPPSDGHSASPEITSLCSTISSLDSASSCLGFLKGNDHRYSVYPLLKQQANDDNREFQSLKQLLSKTSTITLTRRQRYFIALTLASSHLQLYNTPWLSNQWNKGDILFLQDDDADAVHLDQPYISRNFPPQPPVSTATTSPPSPRDRGTSTLGIILLELCFGMALEDNPIWREHNPVGVQRNPTLDLVAAIDWCDMSANDEGGPEFADAIGWCLKNQICRKKRGVENEAWREEFVANVMEPLQKCCEIMAGGPLWS